MSPDTRKWVVHALRIGVTVAAVIWVVRMIRWEDSVRITENGVARSVSRREVREIAKSGDRTRVGWADGKATDHRTEDVVEQEGFFSLFRRTNKPFFALMAAALLVPMFFLALRWWLLLRGHGFEAPLGRIFFVTYAGAFFNNFLPGSVGGDLTKAILAASGEDRKAAIAGTVILDRLIGLGVMVVMGAACMTPYLGEFKDPRLSWLLYGMLGAMVAGTLLYLSPPVRGLLGKLPFRRTVEELDGVFRDALRKKRLVAAAAATSLLAQGSSILAIYGLGVAMGITSAKLWMFFIFEPIIFIVTALPISVGGWGVQEKIYAELFGTFGGVDPNQAIALSVLYKLSLILISIPGGVLFGLGATRRKAPALEPAKS